MLKNKYKLEYSLIILYIFDAIITSIGLSLGFKDLNDLYNGEFGIIINYLVHFLVLIIYIGGFILYKKYLIKSKIYYFSLLFLVIFYLIVFISNMFLIVFELFKI